MLYICIYIYTQSRMFIALTPGSVLSKKGYGQAECRWCKGRDSMHVPWNCLTKRRFLCQGNVSKRLEYISGELERPEERSHYKKRYQACSNKSLSLLGLKCGCCRSNKIITEKETELGEKQKHLIKFESQLVQTTCLPWVALKRADVVHLAKDAARVAKQLK